MYSYRLNSTSRAYRMTYAVVLSILLMLLVPLAGVGFIIWNVFKVLFYVSWTTVEATYMAIRKILYENYHD